MAGITKIKSFGFTPQEVANWFICHIDRDSGDSITHLKLQKLMYYAQSWSLAIFGKSLFDNDFQAWTHGPVLPEIFNQYKEYGFNSIPICACKNKITGQVEELFFDINAIYGNKTAKYLEDLTHQEKPWQAARQDLPLEAASNSIIPKDLMLNFYRNMSKQNGAKK